MLFGRGAELERIDTLLEGAQSGRGGGLIVRGDPGIGKTALLEEARERAGQMAVATASGVESEARLPFAALGELASPMLDRVAELPEPQAAAISAALALAPAKGIVNERLATFAGFLGLIRATARDRPLLLLVDDAHWLDRPSSECLGYAARRLGDVSAALLVAPRTGVEIEPLGGSAEELPLAGLARREALALLSDADLAPAVAERLVDLSLGNPLALRELPSMLSEEQRRGVTPIDPVPAPNGALAEAFGRRVTAAGPNAAALLLVASAALDRTLAPVIAAARDLGIPDRALEQCESAGLLETDGEGFRFAHPLVRGIVYAAAPAPERRRAHGALAVHTSPDSRAWHLAEAAIGPDDEVAAELDRAARRAGEPGAHTAAADALERAAALSSESADRFGRLHAAGLAAAMSGGYERGAALLESAAGTEDPGRRATARHLLAMVTLNGGIATGSRTTRC